MKAKPVRLVQGQGYVQCEAGEATHVTLRIPGPTGLLTLPVLQGNSARAGTGRWTWNGSTEAPTLRPSVMTQYDGADRQWRCHSWITDGAAQFLADCSHDMANATVPLLDVCEPPNVGGNRLAPTQEQTMNDTLAGASPVDQPVGRPLPKRYEGGRIKGGCSLHDAEKPELCQKHLQRCPEPRTVDCCGVVDEHDIVECHRCGRQWTVPCNFDEDYS